MPLTLIRKPPAAASDADDTDLALPRAHASGTPGTPGTPSAAPERAEETFADTQEHAPAKSYPTDSPAKSHANDPLPLLAMNTPAAAWIAGFAPSRRAALARAQAAWLTRQVTLDPRLALHSSQITADELYHAMCIFRSLFDRAASAHMTLRAALDWAALLVDAADLAEQTHSISPLPYLWMPESELEAAEAERRESAARTSKARSRRRAHVRREGARQ